MNRITQKDLEGLVLTLNKTTGQPLDSYAVRHDDTGKDIYVAQIGNYHLSYAYGRVALEQMTNEHGGVRRVLGSGTKRELFQEIQALLNGYTLAKSGS